MILKTTSRCIASALATFTMMFALGCSSASTTPAASVSDGGTDSASSTASAQEQAALRSGEESSLQIQQMLTVADSIFRFDPDLEPGKPDVANAEATRKRATESVGGCGSASLAGTTVTVSFGPAPGCKLASGITVSGSLTAGVSSAGKSDLDKMAGITVAVTFKSLVVDGTSLDGAVSFLTKNGSTFTVTATNLTSGTTTTNANLTVVGAPGSMTIDGTASSTNAGATTAVSFQAVVVPEKACYPNSGSLSITSSGTTMTMTFSASTPTTGTVEVSFGGKIVTTSTLPAYGSCPSGRDAG